MLTVKSKHRELRNEFAKAIASGLMANPNMKQIHITGTITDGKALAEAVFGLADMLVVESLKEKP